MAPKSTVDRPYDIPDPNAPSNYQRDIYAKLGPPIFSTRASEWERLAKKKVPAANYGYVFGSASSGATYQANLEAFGRYRLRPKMLVNATRRDIGVSLFGTKLSSPILCAPVGVQNIMHKDAEIATARACRNVDIPLITSTAATRTIEEISVANGDGVRWYQLYWPKPQDEEVTLSLLKRAKDNGYSVLVVTLDTFTLAWRPTDLDTAYLPFLWGEGCQIGHSDPVFNARYQESLRNDTRSMKEYLSDAYQQIIRPGSLYGAMNMLFYRRTLLKSQAWLNVMNSGTYRTWPDLAFLKEHWDGPIILKGIQTVEDAHKAIEAGMDGIVVSNHGGRQLDGAIASLDALADICADEKVKNSSLEILFDSGIRTGSDILKALCLGAKAVLVGRPFMYGLAIAGREGVEHVFKCMKADFDNQLGNLGKTRVEDLNRDDLQVWGGAKL